MTSLFQGYIMCVLSIDVVIYHDVVTDRIHASETITN